MLYAFLPDRWADYIMHVGHVANRSFGGFLTGQIIDSAIVGLLCFLGMSVMNMPYAMLSSVIVGVTNIIPYFGPIIGAIPGVVLLLLSNPIKAVLFIILIVCIQSLTAISWHPGSWAAASAYPACGCFSPSSSAAACSESPAWWQVSRPSA
ncbi:MAG: AI-2E family transporter [Acutalibacteraceae bacterium]